MLGFHEELSNFKLSLNNPSTQGEMLKVEQWKEKVLLYKDLVYRWYENQHLIHGQKEYL